MRAWACFAGCSCSSGSTSSRWSHDQNAGRYDIFLEATYRQACTVVAETLPSISRMTGAAGRKRKRRQVLTVDQSENSEAESEAGDCCVSAADDDDQDICVGGPECGALSLPLQSCPA